MSRISACIISFNEEKKIEDCLKSLVDVADEIVIVDSGSTDNTLEIARRYTSKIYHHEFAGYGKQKNFAVEKADYDWIISLDCDERLSGELRASILSLKDSLDSDAVYSMPRRTFYIYRWLSHCWYPDTKVRLFNRTKTRWLDNDVHESIDTSGIRVIPLKGDILHYSFDSFSDHLKTIDRFTETGANDLLKQGKRIGAITPLTHASWTFIKLYILKRGFLDGFAGLAVAVLSYMHVFIKYARAYIMQKNINQQP